MTTYYHISVKVAGRKTKRHTFAELINEKGDMLTFRPLKKDGEDTSYIRGDVEHSEIIVGFRSDFVIKPARMNQHYGELEVISTDPFDEPICCKYATAGVAYKPDRTE